VRLYDRQRARWAADPVHEALEVDGRISQLKGDLLHFPYRSWADQMERADRYTRLAVQAAGKKGNTGAVLKLLFGPPAAFLRTFFFRAGSLDGWRGAAIAYAGARYVFLRQFRILR